MTSVRVERRVGRYEILGEVGRGATAIVHVARQTDLDRDVALKELAALRSADSAVVERFLRESRLVAGLNHPNIVTVYEYFEHEGTPFIAMEYLPRGSLRPLVGSLELPQIAGVLECVLGGLAHAETRGVVHRDLKPENLLVTASGDVKITDFGIAKALDAESGALTQTGTTVGTPAYMAPEQAMAGEVGPQADLYATGVIAYELLAGTVPFHGSSVAMAVMLQHLNELVPPLREARPDLDPELCVWVERMLAKQPEQRPPGAASALEELDEIAIRVLGPRWRRRSRLTGSMPSPRPAVSVATADTRIAPAPPPGARRRRLVTVALAAVLGVVVLATGVGVAVALSADDGSPGAAPTGSTPASDNTTEPVRPELHARATLNAVDLDTRADPSKATLRFTGAALGSVRIVLRDADISDGHAWFELERSGIEARTRGAANDSLAVRVRNGKNLLRVDLRAAPGAFSQLRVRPAGRTVVATLQKPAPTSSSNESTGGVTVTEPPVTTPPAKPPKKALDTG